MHTKESIKYAADFFGQDFASDDSWMPTPEAAREVHAFLSCMVVDIDCDHQIGLIEDDGHFLLVHASDGAFPDRRFRFCPICGALIA